MDHDLGRGLGHRRAQRVPVENIDDCGARSGRAHLLGPRFRAGHARYLVARVNQLRHERPAYRAGRARHEHPHLASSLSLRSIQPSSSVVSSRDTKLAGPSQDGSDSPMSIR